MIYAILQRLGQMVFVMVGISMLVFLIFFGTPGVDPAVRGHSAGWLGGGGRAKDFAQRAVTGPRGTLERRGGERPRAGQCVGIIDAAHAAAGAP